MYNICMYIMFKFHKSIIKTKSLIYNFNVVLMIMMIMVVLSLINNNNDKNNNNSNNNNI